MHHLNARHLPALFAALAVVGLAACGGGGGEAPVATSPPPASVPPPPAAAALPDAVTLTVPPYVEAGTAVALASSQGSGQAGLTYRWEFGDGSTADTAQVGSRSYPAGRYLVRLTVGNGTGSTRSASAQLLVGRQGDAVDRIGCAKADGKAWCQQTANAANLDFRTAVSGWITGTDGHAMRTRDGGQTWQVRPTGTNYRLSAARFADDDHGWLFGSSGQSSDGSFRYRLLRTTDGGATWAEQTLADPDRFTGGRIQMRVVDASRAIVHSPLHSRVTSDGGATWRVAAIVPTSVLPSGRIWSITDNGTLRMSDDLGLTTVREVDPGGRVVGLAFANDLVGTVHVNTGGDAEQKILRTVDGGQTWTAMAGAGLPRAQLATLSTLQMADANVAWLSMRSTTTSAGAAVNRTTAYRSTDGGANWIAVPLPAGYETVNGTDILQLLPNGLVGLVVGGGSAGLYTRNAGLSWIRPSGPGGAAVGTLVGAGSTVFAAYGGRWGRLGDDWTVSPTGWIDPPLLTKAGATPTDAGIVNHFFDGSRWLASAGLDVFETRDAERNWTVKIATDTSFMNPNIGNYSLGRAQFSTSSQGRVLVAGTFSETSDGGDTFRFMMNVPIVGPALVRYNDADFQADGTAITVVDSGPIVLQADGVSGNFAPGATVFRNGAWTPYAVIPFEPRSVRWAAATTAVVSGTAGRIARSIDGGLTWSEVTSGVTQDLVRLTAAPNGDLWAVGNAGTVIRSTDAGQSWRPVAVGVTANLRALVFSDAQNAYIVGAAGTVIASHDGGITWTRQATGTQRDITAVYAVQPGVMRMMTADGNVFASSTGGY